jgi:hypothetical protein
MLKLYHTKLVELISGNIQRRRAKGFLVELAATGYIVSVGANPALFCTGHDRLLPAPTSTD